MKRMSGKCACIEQETFPHVMSSACESPCPWTDHFLETINKLTLDLVNFSSSTFGFPVTEDDVRRFAADCFRKLAELLDELTALLSFDEFQLQLLKVFFLTFVSTVALIFVAWHIYGSRISEQFMEPSSTATDCDSSSGE